MMYLENKYADFGLRVVVGVCLGLVFGWLISQAGYYFTPDKESVQREPHQVVLDIPYGTADQVKQGAFNPNLPGSLTFVQGDVLIVKNEDKVPHQLGPLLVMPSTSSVLTLDTANQYSYTCSFTPDNNIGLDVLPRVTGGLQFQAMLSIGLPTGMMLALYSYMLPGRKKKPVEAVS